ncbi:hypothetical protein [Neobacillus kokaensis]|uniref:Uncharacterized protein n=1 Tax=Neobacillus kokaensis TaxID=2759023 RepID=A0ABQ3NA83_9BACI|nr:hypothetical protein [Neobacillus kokaensis]GHI00969.1 hypothetical protein AM1BK_45110 [Neobacillus kokaensis]
MSIDLLTKLEEEKDQWIYKAIIRFDKELLQNEEITGEHQIMQIKNMHDSRHRQKTRELEQTNKDIKLVKESHEEVEQSFHHLNRTAHSLQEEIAHYEGLITDLDTILLEKFNCDLDKKFEFDQIKGQVLFKDRKTTKLVKSFDEMNREMDEFYQMQLDKGTSRFGQFLPIALQTNPPVRCLSLKHGRGLDRYLVLKNFEDDYQIVQDTLNENNSAVYNYYVEQLNHFKQYGKKVLLQMCTLKKEHLQNVFQEIEEKEEQNRAKEMSISKLEEKLTKVHWEWNHDLDRLRKLDEILKEEFVNVVSEWQEKLFAKQTSDVDRWLYHQYCQIILKQSGRIFKNEYS